MNVEEQIPAPVRGAARSLMRAVACKDCRRELRELETRIGAAREAGESTGELEGELTERTERFVYNEQWALGRIDRGESRSDRCEDHRRSHRSNIQGIAVAHIAIRTLGSVRDAADPRGPLGGLGALPALHEARPGGADLAAFEFGMTDAHIVEILELLRHKQVVVLKAGTGTGKSTFAPYRLMDPPIGTDLARLGIEPPRDGMFDLASLGPIVVTEPRVQAATGVATFVGTQLSGARGVGAGFPVGYQVRGDRNHNEACQLIYVTDGTMINWLREGRLSRIGTVIVDEAHERSTNIDFIIGYLRRNLHNYPHLRVIITSATFDAGFYQEYFGGPDVAAVKTVDPVKTVGYGMPLFADLDDPVAADWPEAAELPLLQHGSRDQVGFAARHWKFRYAPPLGPGDVVDPGEVGWVEDLHATTRILQDLRFTGAIPVNTWSRQMPSVLTDFVVSLVQGLDREGIHGDVLGFLPTYKTIDTACEELRRRLGADIDVYALKASTTPAEKKAALEPRRKGDRRKVVVSTNLAETSLTVEGVRFVVDSGLITQAEWDPALVQKDIRARPHSRSGIRQRWGRVGRTSPGWVFPLYTKEQYAGLDEDTPPGSTRENLESLVLTTRLGGIDDVTEFPWPAAFEPVGAVPTDSVRRSMEVFRTELSRADRALKDSGAVDADGHPTTLGRELHRFQGDGSVGRALSIMYADRLACVPEVAAILCLLENRDNKPLLTEFADSVLEDSCSWADEYRLDAALRHRGLAGFATDEAHLALLIMAAWERADPDTVPWQDSAKRQRWCSQWYVGAELLAAAASTRQDIIGMLSPAMKEATKRFVEPALLDRARLCISLGFKGYRYRRVEQNYVRVGAAADGDNVVLDDRVLAGRAVEEFIPLCRKGGRSGGPSVVSGIVEVTLPRGEGAGIAETGGAVSAMTLLTEAARRCRADPARDVALEILALFPVGQRMKLVSGGRHAVVSSADIGDVIAPFAREPKPEGGRLARLRGRFDGTGSDVDATGELGSIRPGYRGDEESEQAAEFRRIDSRVDAVCGACDACRSGRDTDCDDPGQPAGPDRGDDGGELFAQWTRRLAANRELEPALRIVGEHPAPTGWYEVVGYEYRDGHWEVLIELDWRPSTYVGDPAAQPGTASGDVAIVRVGPTTADHQGPVRLFYRVDRPGRFVLREAERGHERQEDFGQVAVSLDREHTAQLAQLKLGAVFTATVIAARSAGCFTITLLEVLRRHVDTALSITTQVGDDRAPGGARTARLLPGVVHSRPNGRGRFQIRLLHQDSRSGVQHVFGYPVVELPVGRGGVPAPGTPVLMELGSAGRVQLDVAGKPRSAVEKICAAGTIRLVDSGDRAATALPGGAKVTALAGSAVSRACATALAALDDSADWLNEVWTFWARTHHRQPVWSTGLLPSTDTSEREVLIPQRLDDHNGGEQVQQFDRFVESYQEGSELTGVVDRFERFGALISIGTSLHGRLATGNIARFWIDSPASVLTIGERIAVRVVGIDREKRTVELSRKELTPEPYEYAKAACKRGDLVACTVRNVTEHRVFAVLGAGIQGSIPRRDFTQDSAQLPQLVSRGDQLVALIRGFNDDHRSLDLVVKGVPAGSEPTFVPVNNWIGPSDDSAPAEQPPAQPPAPASPAAKPRKQPEQDVPDPVAETPQARVCDVRDGCVVTDLGGGRFRIRSEHGATIEVDADDYRSDARPLHWLRAHGEATR
ncbi:helicase-related protein [Nocardia salmonicida]|uniref:helicase-related protein n=1 Tax=Nocardia salmonicida TaxID=53431 RepID=UPI0007A415F2|nr:helicase-related protein [Nocardia salmonicida]